MAFFTKIDGAVALTYRNGVYAQADVYTRNELVFIKQGSGFARVAPPLGGTYATTVPNLRVEEFDLPPACKIQTRGHQLIYKGAWK